SQIVPFSRRDNLFRCVFIHIGNRAVRIFRISNVSAWPSTPSPNVARSAWASQVISTEQPTGRRRVRERRVQRRRDGSPLLSGASLKPLQSFEGEAVGAMFDRFSG